ncbi:hypothetical protein DPEC_G00199260 [Dallia pectoralis]|uniref:Uncharacterized protein n=1 Tax=Dallia pectoralis TaxID=75939 RepID=A0ACC2G8W0_DALPE|nr:hypothetical protein DPEC_G00199260 [Dallia pectoralis]
MSVTISTLNTRSIRYPDRRRTVLGHLTTKPADIFLLQECGIPYKEMDGLLEEGWTLGSSFWSGSNIARADGVGILMTNPYILSAPGGGGDFNCALRDEDRSKQRRDRSSKELQAIIDDFSLTDVGGSIPPTPTWVSSSGASYSRIDMFLLSPGLRMRSLTSEVAHFSDHRMVTVTLDWEGLVKIGRGSWRMNTSVLGDQTVRRSFSRRYLEWRTLKELYDSPIEWWEMVKDRVKGYFGGVGRRKAREKRASFNHHNKALQRLSLLQLEGFEVARELSETKEHLATLYREEQKKSQYRSKLRYFFRKARSRQKPILSLYYSQGDSVKNSADILRAAGDFYGRLYDTKPADRDLATAFLEGLNRVIEGGECEDPEMSIEELTRAVHCINKQKAPGPDGIPGEFYQTFWDLIKNEVAEVFQAIYRVRRLGESMQQSTITLVPKKRDLKDFRNWRPINLLSVDYKIMTKALTKRFQSHLPTVIAADQICSIPEWSINDNLLLVRDVILHSQERGSPLGLLSLDQEKAFDRVSHGFLQRVLKKMNFPQHLINWTNLCYQTSAAECW